MSQQGSHQGSTYGVSRWLSDLPSNFDPPGDCWRNWRFRWRFQRRYFWQYQQSHKKYGFGPTMRKNTNSERIKLKVNHLNGKRTSINKVVKETAKKKQQSLGKYLEAVKGFDKEKKKSGERIRKYKQPKRNPNVVYSFSGDTRSSIAFYILSLFIDSVSDKLVQSCYLITVLSHRSVIPQLYY